MMQTICTRVAASVVAVAMGLAGLSLPTSSAANRWFPSPSAARPSVLRQGQYIMTNEKGWSLTVIDSRTAYTARHCSSDMGEIGAPIYGGDRRLIGRVAAAQPGFDVVRIALERDTSVPHPAQRRDYDTLIVGEPLHVAGLDKVYPESAYSNEGLIDWVGHKQIGAVVKPMNSEEGTSGGPMLDRAGRVVGVSVGGVSFTRPGIPVEFGSVFIPWHIIDAELGR